MLEQEKLWIILKQSTWRWVNIFKHSSPSRVRADTLTEQWPTLLRSSSLQIALSQFLQTLTEALQKLLSCLSPLPCTSSYSKHPQTWTYTCMLKKLLWRWEHTLKYTQCLSYFTVSQEFITLPAMWTTPCSSQPCQPIPISFKSSQSDRWKVARNYLICTYQMPMNLDTF